MASVIITFDPINRQEPYTYMAKTITDNSYVIGNIIVKKPWYSHPSQHRYYIVENEYSNVNFLGGRDLKGFKTTEVDPTTIEPYNQVAKIKYNQSIGLDVHLVKNFESTDSNNTIAIIQPNDIIPITLWNVEIETRALILSDAQQLKALDKISDFKIFDFVEDMFFEDEPQDYAYGIFLNNELIGYCTIGSADFYKQAKSDDELLSDVFVREEYRNNGYASKLITYVLKQHDKHDIFADVWFDNLEPFYKTFGFKRYDKNTPGLLILKRT